MAPRKLVTARPISAPYSSCQRRMDSGDPSKPDRLASTTAGRLPLAALRARANFRDDWGNKVPAVSETRPVRRRRTGGAAAAATRPRAGRPGSRRRARPRRRRSRRPPIGAIARAARWSWSLTALMTDRMSNALRRSGLCSSEKISPTSSKSVPSTSGVRRRRDVTIDRVVGLRPARAQLARARCRCARSGAAAPGTPPRASAPSTAPGRSGP